MKRSRILAALALAVLAGAAPAQTLKLGTIAPENSPWGAGLRRLVADWTKLSGGTVTLRNFYGTVGDEIAIQKKMKVGGLDLGVFTTQGLARFYDDILVLSLPSIVQTDSELTVTMDKLDAKLRSEMEARGYTIITWSKGGWVYFVTRKPVAKPADIVGIRVAVAADDAKMAKMLNAAGCVAVPIPSAETVTQFMQGSIDAFFVSPLLLATQWSFLRNTKTYMTGMRVAPFIGAIVASTAKWNRVPANLKTGLLAAADRMTAELGATLERDETAAIETMKRDGLVYVPVSEADRKEWNVTFVTNRNRLIKDLFSKEILALIDEAVAGMRK